MSKKGNFKGIVLGTSMAISTVFSVTNGNIVEALGNKNEAFYVYIWNVIKNSFWSIKDRVWDFFAKSIVSESSTLNRSETVVKIGDVTVGSNFSSSEEMLETIEKKYERLKKDKPELILKAILECISPENSLRKGQSGIFLYTPILEMVKDDKKPELLELIKRLKSTKDLLPMKDIDDESDEDEPDLNKISACGGNKESRKKLKKKNCSKELESMDSIDYDLKMVLDRNDSLTKKGYIELLNFLSENLSERGKMNVLGYIVNGKVEPECAKIVLGSNWSDNFFKGLVA